MYQLSSRIEIFDNPLASKPKWVATAIAGVEISTQITSLTDTCTITIPKKIVWRDDQKIITGNKSALRRGNKIIISLGYNGELYPRFVGYIRKVMNGLPTKISLDDSMWLLKQNPVNDSWDSETLGGFIKRIIPASIKTVCDDPSAKIGAFRIKNSTPAQALEKLIQDYPLFATFMLVGIIPVLHIGLAIPDITRKEITFAQGRDIINPDNLEWRNADDVKVKVIVKNKRYSSGKEIEDPPVEFGDPDGETHTIYMLNADEESMKKYARAKLEQFKYSGLYGTFDTFGHIPVNKGDIVNLILEEGSGKYYVKSVKIEFGKGYKQTVELGGKVV